MVTLYVIREKRLKSNSYPVFRFNLPHIGENLLSIGIGGGAFLLIWGMLKIVASFLLGYQIPFIQIRSLLIAPLVFYGINLIICDYYAKQHDPTEKGFNLHFIVLYVTVYVFLLLPLIFVAGFSVTKYFLYFLLLALLNPGYYGKGYRQWSIAWFNYFLMSFFFTWNIL